MAKQPFRITYRSEIYIDAENFEDAEKCFENMTNEELHDKSEFVEVVSVEDEQNRTKYEVE